jgi:hypothetical protein
MSRIFGSVRQNGYVVRDIRAALAHWTERLGVGPFYYIKQAPIEDFRYRGKPSDCKCAIALANSGDLLSAQGSVTCMVSPCVVGAQHRITVMWDSRRNGATGTGCNSANLSDLICHRITVVP